MELIPLAKKDTPQQPEEELSSGDSLKLDLYFWLQALVMALVALILLFTFVGRIIGVDGSSMYPTLHHGDMLLLQSVGYEPKQGDVVVLTKPFDLTEGPIVKRVIAVGGAQAVAALAYGTETVPQVDKIVGPGGVFVAAAKRKVFGQVDIDMIAGPSEILVVADGKSDPAWVAADLLSQAEHDAHAAAVLVTDSRPLAEAVQNEVERQLTDLPRRDIAQKSLEANGKILVTKDLAAAMEAANRIAPEHLELCVDDPFALLPLVKNAGSVFLGRHTPEALGDYFAGPNHTLPTSGTARFSSPLSVDDFVKKTQFIYYTREALADAAPRIADFAEREGLHGHARSALSRTEEKGE